MLVLPLKKNWFDMEVKGIKKDEYREITDYWSTRFMNYFGFFLVNGEIVRGTKNIPEIAKNDIQLICFRNGYSGTSPEFVARCSISIGTGKTEWGAETGKQYYKIHIHEIISILNYKSGSGRKEEN